MKKISNYLTAAVFIAVILGMSVLFIVSPKDEVSVAERRKLAAFPKFSMEDLMKGDFFKNMDSYVTDQFPMRDDFRKIGAQVRFNVLAQSDNKGIYINDGYVFKSDYPVKTRNIEKFAEGINRVYRDHIKGKAKSCYVSVIPDKSHFDTSKHLKNDAKLIADTFVSKLEGWEYIDIFDSLSLESYYRTDTHWSQDKLAPVMKTIAEQMDFSSDPEKYEYKENVLEPFYGVYWGQSAMEPAPDKLVYLTNEAIDKATVKVFDNDCTKVYNLDSFNGIDGYDVFLSGASPIVEITSPLGDPEKELVIFRDSFGSSIAPLFLEEYGKVTLVDLRYIASSLLDEYVDMENSDVLMLYSTLILNSGLLIK